MTTRVTSTRPPRFHQVTNRGSAPGSHGAGESFAILVPPHPLRRLDQGIAGENPAGTTREPDLDALSENAIVVANVQDLAKRHGAGCGVVYSPRDA